MAEHLWATKEKTIFGVSKEEKGNQLSKYFS